MPRVSQSATTTADIASNPAIYGPGISVAFGDDATAIALAQALASQACARIAAEVKRRGSIYR